MDATIAVDNGELFLARHQRRNYWLYMLTILFSSGASPFGDMNVLVPSLAMHFHAPSWLVVLPAAGGRSIAFAPALLIGWFLSPRTSRTKTYAWSVALMYVPILILAIFLFEGAPNPVLLPVFTVCIVVYSLAMGCTILPCWDLFARVFPATRRTKVVGQAGAIGQGAILLTAGAAAALISTHSPLPYPRNYAAAMLVFSTGGLICSCIILLMKEYLPPPEPGDPPLSFTTYLRKLRSIITTDRQFTATVKIAAAALTIGTIFPLFLTYARQQRGFTGPNDLAILVGVSPYIGIPLSLLFGHIAHRIGSMKMSAALACLMMFSVPLAMTVWGKWQFVPLFGVMLGANLTTYSMLAVINRARSEHTSYYLAIYFTSAIIPGMVPLVLARIFDWRPVVALAGIFVIAAGVAIGFILTERQTRPDGSAAGAASRAEPNADAHPSTV